ncbi:NDR1/HIN1-like protein 13 [Magnolia sinica]|uniref:NDR1/HIN1-like protein 13 n=1 Tax=Magnolia sinica TaxID=86752 RepID=UPI00265A5FC8|nr:NDR1/HIN1-like protein 13 [Magnolia sinica]
MSERVHPAGDSPSTSGNRTQAPEKPVPPPGAYVIQVPKDQIYRYPPQEKSGRHQTGRKPRRNCCCRCLCWTIGLLLLLVILAAATVAILYLIFRPKIPEYSVESLSIKGFNFNFSSDQTSLTFSPEIDVSVRAENPNGKIGIYYEKGSSVSVFYSDLELCNGVLPVFYQGTKNVTVFRTALTGEGVLLTGALHGTLAAQQRKGEIPLELDLRVPVKVKFGAVKTWTITVKVRCGLTVNKLAEDSRIISKTCKVKVDV